MNKKLTLSLDNDVIDKAKIYARNHKKSLSNLVENYFRLIILNIKKEKSDFSKLVKELIGSVKVPENFNYDDAKYEYLKDKYLND